MIDLDNRDDTYLMMPARLVVSHQTGNTLQIYKEE